ncbi:CHAD domain-containing protein [uncultured Microscilla sp.]|uniref:CHAD domain-containing protein n=1 Tax=uncultured Microscilla sp. TaxID=432653 RepID=UPI00261E3B53|nr:CHAD domain-containing protein [uncultured Microscilla sp.]
MNPPSTNDTLVLWHQHFQDILATFEQYAAKIYAFEDEEDVHQARVALRTITTLTGFLKSSPHKSVDPKLLNQVHLQSRLILKSLGKIRDFDVMIGHVDKINAGSFQLHTLMQALRLERKIARIELVLHLPKYLNKSFFELWQTFLELYLPLHVPHLKTKRHFKKLHKKFDRRYLNYLTQRDILGATHPRTFEALHEVRLVTKNLRYAYTYLDFALHKTVTKTIAAKVKNYKLIQEELGLMNDYTNLRAKMHQMLEDYPYLVNQETLGFRDKVNKKLKKNLRKIKLPQLKLIQ